MAKSALEIFNIFKEIFLENKKSIFREKDDDEILNEENIDFLIENFIENGKDGPESFIEKIESQLIHNDNKNTIQQNAIEILAHCIFLWRLVPANSSKQGTINSIKEILNLDDSLKEIDVENNQYINDYDYKGIAAVGTYYNTNKPFEIAFIIKFLDNYLKNKNSDIIDILTNTTNCEDGEGCITIKINNKETTKRASIFNALLYFLAPDKYEPIVSYSHKNDIVEAFEEYIKNECEENFRPEIDCKIYHIKQALKEEYDFENFYDKKISKYWKTTEINLFRNIIYHGAPGTGKTYEAKKEIEEYIEKEEHYKFIQFHGAYTYEDFIGGLKPDISDENSNGIKLIYKNGIFKELCKEAAKYEIAYYKEAEKDKSLPQKLDENTKLKKDLELLIDEKEIFIIKKNIPVLSQFPPFFILIDEINRADLSRVFGELLFAIEDDYRGFENKIQLSSASMETKESAVYWKDKKAYFFVPKNLYIRATMNDIDKSIDSIDLHLEEDLNG
ncbi:hypothetical protein JCM11957_03310 [Caminibacter profundus]